MFRCESKRYAHISLLSLSMIFWVELCMHIHFAVSCEMNPNGSVVFGSRVHCIAYVSCPSLGCVDLNTHIKFQKMWTIRSDARHRMTRISNHPQVFPVFKLKITTAFSEPMNIWFVLVVNFEWLSDIECCFQWKIQLEINNKLFCNCQTNDEEKTSCSKATDKLFK